MTTAEQWERLARDANAAAVKAMAEADRLRAELAGPTNALPSIACSCRFHGPNGDHWDCGRDCGCDGPQAGWQWRTVLRAAFAAAPVGGQTEPSDAQIEAAYSVGYAAMRYDSATWFDSLRKAVPDMLRAAAVSGEHRNQDGKTHQGPADGGRADEDGVVFMPEGEAVETGTEWRVFAGGPDPDDCAMSRVVDGEAEAEENAAWIIGGLVACRKVDYGPWQIVPPAAPVGGQEKPELPVCGPFALYLHGECYSDGYETLDAVLVDALELAADRDRDHDEQGGIEVRSVPAAPVGGQAELSDAMVERIADAIAARKRPEWKSYRRARKDELWRADAHGMVYETMPAATADDATMTTYIAEDGHTSLRPFTWREVTAEVLRAAAVSGEQS